MTTDIFNLKEKLESAVAEAFRNGIKDHTLEIKCQNNREVIEAKEITVTLQPSSDPDSSETISFIINARLVQKDKDGYPEDSFDFDASIERPAIEFSAKDIRFTSKVLIARKLHSRIKQ